MMAGQTKKCVKLHRAAMRGDWRSVINDPDMRLVLTHTITEKEETALHVAAALKQYGFAVALLKHVRENLGNDVTKCFLEIENCSGNTALCYAALTTDDQMARVMVNTYEEINGGEAIPSMPKLPNLGTVKPVLAAACMGHKNMVEYLLEITDIGNGWSGKDRNELFIAIIRMGLYDKALKMLTKHEDLAIAGDGCETPLHVLASTPSAFLQKGTKVSESDASDSWEVINLVEELCRIVRTRCRDPEDDTNPEVVIEQTLLLAAEEGNTELVIHLLRSDPDMIWVVFAEHRSIFHIAIEKRHESIFTLLHEFGAIKDLIAKEVVDGRNNMLHLAAELASQSKLNLVSGAALQMQRELFWFKEVEKVVPASYKDKRNLRGLTPGALFTETHEGLRRAGEEWMKKTAESCMLVATLIATVMFAAIITVPGGYDDSSGKPLLQDRTCFWIFSFSDAVALFSSAVSILMFLSILTSRYAEMDFLRSLPFRLTVGVTSLFVSVGSMMVAFCATFLLYYPGNFPWFFAAFCVLGVVSVLFVVFRYPLLADLIVSAHRTSCMFKWPKRIV